MKILGRFMQIIGWIIIGIVSVFVIPLGIIFYIGITFRDSGERMGWPKIEGVVESPQ